MPEGRHTAKCPSWSCASWTTHDKVEDFVECLSVWHLAKSLLSSVWPSPLLYFAECLIKGTQQNLLRRRSYRCVEFTECNMGFAECFGHSAKRTSPITFGTHTKKKRCKFFLSKFAPTTYIEEQYFKSLGCHRHVYSFDTCAFGRSETDRFLKASRSRTQATVV